MAAFHTSKESSKLVPGPVSPKPTRKYFGYICGIINVVVHPFTLGTAQALGGVVPVFEQQVLRYVAVLIVCVIVIHRRDLDVRSLFREQSLPFVTVYLFLEITHHITSFLSVRYISVTAVLCLRDTIEVGLGFAGTLLLTRLCKLPQALATCLCLIGVICVTQPEFLFGSFFPGNVMHKSRSVCGEKSSPGDVAVLFHNVSGLDFNANYTVTNSTQIPEPHAEATYPGYIFGCATPVMVVTMYFIGSGQMFDVSGFVLLFWASIFGIGSSTILMFIFNKPAFPKGATCISLLLGHIACFSINHIAYTCALIEIPPLIIATMCTLQLVVGLIGQYTVLRHINPGHGNAVEIVGTLIVMLGNVLGPFYEMYKLRKDPSHREDSAIGGQSTNNEESELTQTPRSGHSENSS